MNYRHIYHAGNFADIIKHITLIAVLEQLTKKDKALAVLDGFAGIGKYDLSSPWAIKTGESEGGIKKLLQLVPCSSSCPQLIQQFLALIKDDSNHNIYLGSPLIISRMLRSSDRLIACELHPEDYRELKKVIFTNTHNIDAYVAIKAFLPFKEKRGLIFLDPPFEAKDEFDKIINALKTIKQRMSNTCILIWYPIKNQPQVNYFYQNYQKIGFKEAIKIEFELSNSAANLNKCGLLVINPPDIQNQLNQTIGYLTKNLYTNGCNYNIVML